MDAVSVLLFFFVAFLVVISSVNSFCLSGVSMTMPSSIGRFHQMLAHQWMLSIPTPCAKTVHALDPKYTKNSSGEQPNHHAKIAASQGLASDPVTRLQSTQFVNRQLHGSDYLDLTSCFGASQTSGSERENICSCFELPTFCGRKEPTSGTEPLQPPPPPKSNRL